MSIPPGSAADAVAEDGWEVLLCPPDETLGGETPPSSPRPLPPPPPFLWSPISRAPLVVVTAMQGEDEPVFSDDSGSSFGADSPVPAPVAESPVPAAESPAPATAAPPAETPPDGSSERPCTPPAPRKSRRPRDGGVGAPCRARRRLRFSSDEEEDEDDGVSPEAMEDASEASSASSAASSSSGEPQTDWRRSPAILRGRVVRRARLRRVARDRFRVRQCPCDSALRHRLRCEVVVVNGRVGVARCPLCRDSSVETGMGVRRTASLPARPDGVTEDSDGGLVSAAPRGARLPRSPRYGTRVIASPWPGFRCLTNVFDGMRWPREVFGGAAVGRRRSRSRSRGSRSSRSSRSSQPRRGSDFVTVYLPRDDTFCDRRCLTHVDGRLVGRGSFGRVYVLPEENTAVKVGGVSSLEETVLTAWISGRVRARAEEQGHVGCCGGSVYRQILVATGCCLRHRVMSFYAFTGDLYGFSGWKTAALPSYRRAFAGLADALRFLNLDCGVTHFDVTPMNVLVLVDPQRPSELQQAVLCDFSLSQPHYGLDGRCALYCEETGDVRLLPPTVYALTDLYHPAFKPLALQKLCVVDPTRHYAVLDPAGLCVTDLTALAQVVTFCLVRLVHPGGLQGVRHSFENALFDVARETCAALQRKNVDEVAVHSSRLLTHQLAYAAAVVGVETLRPSVARLTAFFQRCEGTEPAERFRDIYKRVCRHLDTTVLARRVRELVADDQDAAYLVAGVRTASAVVDAVDLAEVRPHDLFPSIR